MFHYIMITLCVFCIANCTSIYKPGIDSNRTWQCLVHHNVIIKIFAEPRCRDGCVDWNNTVGAEVTGSLEKWAKSGIWKSDKIFDVIYCFGVFNFHRHVKSTRYNTGLILGLCAANERPRNFVTTSYIGWVQARVNPAIHPYGKYVVYTFLWSWNFHRHHGVFLLTEIE